MSDWSADVGSSDLQVRTAAPAACVPADRRGRAVGAGPDRRVLAGKARGGGAAGGGDQERLASAPLLRSGRGVGMRVRGEERPHPPLRAPSPASGRRDQATWTIIAPCPPFLSSTTIPPSPPRSTCCSPCTTSTQIGRAHV